MNKILSIFLFLMIGFMAYSQPSAFLFNHLKEKDGLSDNFVNCFYKDSRGILWIGTQNGLNRYDGAHFFAFKNSKDSFSIVHNTVQDLCEDRNGNIWGATDNGIFCYQVKKNRFKNYTTPNSKIAKAVFNIACDKAGDIWATGLWTILKFHPDTDAFTEIGPLTKNADSLNYYSVRKNGMLEDASGNGLWLATRSGIHYYNKQTNQFTNYKNEVANPLFNNSNIAAFAKSASGNIWFFDNSKKDIVEFNDTKKQIIRRINIATEMPGAVGATLFEDSHQKLWFSSWSTEIIVVDLANNNTITHIKHNKNDMLSVAGDFFWGATEDEDGTVWLGTVGGISKCNNYKTIYKVHRLPYRIPLLNDNTTIVFLTENPTDNSWWIATSQRKIIQYFPVTEKYRIFDLDNAAPDAAANLPGPVISLRFFENTVMVCTHNGSWQYYPESGKIIPFTRLPAEFRSYKLKDMATADDSIYYFESADAILLKWNKFTGATKLIEHTEKRFPDGQKPFTGYMTKRKTQPLWLTSAFGWASFLNNQDRLEPIKLFTDEKKELNGFFNYLDVDSAGNLWLANKGVGLYNYNTATKKVRYWTEADGLVNNHIQTSVVDKTGQVWCASYNKFSVFTAGAGSFYNFSLPLSENNFDYGNWSSLLANGNIITSIYNDIVEFYPQRLSLKPVIKKPEISVLNISGREQLLTTEEQLQLEPDENSLAIKFGLFTDGELFPYSFEYILEGFDKKWIKAISRSEAVYNNLPPGNYTFRLKAFAKNNSWQSAEKVLHINIRTPFYKTTWFGLLVALLIIAVFVFFYRFRMNKQKQILTLETKAASLEKEKTMVQYESLKQHLNPHFLFNSLTSLRSLIKTDSKTASGFLDGMSKVYRYVLKSGEQELVRLQDELDFVKTFSELQKIRFKEGLIVNINVDEKHFNKYIAPVTLQNLVENAIKHNTADKDSPLVIDIFIENDFVIVRNTLQRYNIVETSNKKGLASMQTLYHYYTDKALEIIEDEKYFTIKIPLL